MNRYRLGIDVGGTNTDAVLLDEQLQCVAKIKLPTSADISTGVHRVIGRLLADNHIDPAHIHFAMLGTTQCTNAVVERKGLARVGHLRLSLPGGDSLPPLCGWPAGWREFLGPHFYMLHGGYEFSGEVIADLDETQVRSYCRAMAGQVESVSIAGVFSTLHPQQEQQVAKWVRDELPDVDIGMSHLVGGLGLYERENAAILNASLMPIARQFTSAFTAALRAHGIRALPMFSQNDGSLVSKEQIAAQPVLTIASGPTNSLRGGGHLAKLTDAVIIDVGGTTSDLGVLQHSYPRESAVAANVGGIKTNFRMPDILALALGGGTIIDLVEGEPQIGPASVAYELTRRAKAFGGDQLTLTDVALKLNKLQWRGDVEVDSERLPSHDVCQRVMQSVTEQINQAVDLMKLSADPMPVILVGGGSSILSDQIEGASTVLRPEHFEVANAVGVAIGRVGATVEQILPATENQRQEIFDQLVEQAKIKAIAAGAVPDTIEIDLLDDLPLAYMNNGARRFKVRVSGALG